MSLIDFAHIMRSLRHSLIGVPAQFLLRSQLAFPLSQSTQKLLVLELLLCVIQLSHEKDSTLRKEFSEVCLLI